MDVYDNLLQAIADLKSKGYTIDFNLSTHNIQCHKTGISLHPDEFEIIAHYRFEENTNPDDSSVLYVIHSIDNTIKGILINAYGMYSDASSDALIQKLKVNEPQPPTKNP
jgi:hypothetical protein